VVIAVGKDAKRWLFSESIRNILQTRSISFCFVCHPHYVYTSRGIRSVPGSATWFFHNCIVKSVECCGGFVNFIQDYFTEETDGGRNGLRTFEMLMPGPGSPIVQKKNEMNLDLLKRFYIFNKHMRVPKDFPKDFPKEMQKEVQGLYPFVAKMRHRIVIDRLPPTELGKELKAIGFELHSKPLEGSLNAPTHKWTDEEDRLLLNAQLAIGNDEWNQIVLHHLHGRTPFGVYNHWRQLIGLPKLSNSQRQQSGLSTLSKWTEDEDRILLNAQLAIGNEWLSY
jgi:hypothetical protein